MKPNKSIAVSVDGSANYQAWRLTFPGSTIVVTDGTAEVTTAGGGGGTLNHAALTSNLAWSTSAHTGTASRFAVFDAGGAAAYLAYPTSGVTTWTGSAFSNATISAPLTFSANTLAITQSDATHNGYLSSADWTTFNAKVSASRSISTTLPLAGGGDLSADRTLTLSGWSGTTDGNLLYRSGTAVATATVSGPLTFSAGALAITQSDTTHDGYLSGADFTTFSLKVGTSRTISTTAPLTGGGDLSTNRTIAITQSDATHDGYLSSVDWNTFNGKEPPITAGTTGQYWRGDKVWAALDKAAVGLSLVENTALSTWAGSANLTTLGTIATGVWNGTAITTGYGGTGLASYSAGDLLYYASGTTLSKLAIASAGYFLGSNGSAPGWRQPSDVRSDLGLVIGTNVQAYDAGLTSLTAADASAGLPYVSGANTWATATYTSMLSVVSGAWKVIGWRESGGTDLTNGAISDGQLMARVGTTVAGVNVSATPTASYVVKADGSGKVDGWVSAATTSVAGLAKFAADGGTTASTAVQANDSRLTGAAVLYGPICFAELCGAGASGTATFDGTTAVTGFGTPSSRVYTCATAGDYDWSTLTFDTSGGNIRIITKGSVLRAQTCTVTGSGTVTISFNGGDASGTTGGTGATILTNGILLGGTVGGNGRTTSGSGSAGIAASNGVCLGGQGGVGGGAPLAPLNGGPAGALTRNWNVSSQYGNLVTLLFRLCAMGPGSSSFTPYGLAGGSGGSGTAISFGTGVAQSGGSGGAAGCVALFAKTLATGTGTLVLEATGGAGANATTTSGNNTAGGGAGGGGGGILLAAAVITGSNAIQMNASGGAGANGVKGGTGGVGGGGGTGGGGGDAGNCGCLYGSAVATPTGTATGGTGGSGAAGAANGANGANGVATILQVS